MKKIACLTLLIILLSLFLVSCTPSSKVCKIDADCVPAACCHATETVNKENAPDCNGILCSASCEPNTLDCDHRNNRRAGEEQE